MESPYDQVVTKTIKNDLLVTEPEDLTVTMPTLECLLGDKLTAFAPHTTGVLLGKKKELEIAKQLFDVATHHGRARRKASSYLSVARTQHD